MIDNIKYGLDFNKFSSPEKFRLMVENDFSNLVTKEMKDNYDKRLSFHISQVKKYCYKIDKISSDFDGIIKRGLNHDKDKKEYNHNAFVILHFVRQTPNIIEMTDELFNYLNNSIINHVKYNKHHPEYHSDIDLSKNDYVNGIINLRVDAKEMQMLDIAEMVADWSATSFELGTSAHDWATKNVNVRWNFTNRQINLIYELLDIINY